MTTYSMWRCGTGPLSLILLLVVICARATPLPGAPAGAEAAAGAAVAAGIAEPTASIETALEVQQQQQQSSHRIDCKLTFDATMDSLEQQQQQQHNDCNVLQPTGSSTNKPADAGSDHEDDHEQAQDGEPESANVLRHSMSGSQPLYELQVVVWPADVGAVDDIATTTMGTTAATTKSTTTTTTTEAAPGSTTMGTKTTTASTPTMLPLYEDQLVVFPQMEFDEENFDYFFDEQQPGAASPTTSTSPSPSSSATTAKSTPRPDPSQQVYVLENYRIKHANGTEEHKLVLSNGLANYIKLYRKTVGDRLINVQEGYHSTPVAGQKPQIQTIYYIADERGYNIYKIEQGPQSTVRQMATKPPKPKPNM
ncbi:PREDICTED: uncharacterized protein LOC108620440 [Drosophila arizonae]|uniref:Uncharacterized protein LOC108620440 n=1 Tax=Drosophila arizonae TaxID=7263 RepID=A0ABM1Q048_DROAR|nr:PREDICTED: uncharacterized protein LOC108620440 [Drosophila arizonae]